MIFELKKSQSQFYLYFVFAYLVLLSFLKVDGGGNPAARLAQLASMVEYKSLSIDYYVEQVDREKNWTADWAQGPDGHYYSNKAPGPVFVAYPFYWIYDRLFFRQPSPSERNESRLLSMEQSSFVLSWIFQILPFALLMYLWAQAMKQQKKSEKAIVWTLFALAFSNTNSLFMNTFFGHGLTAVLIAAACYSQFFLKGRSRFFWMAMFWGWALLSDYAVSFAVPLILLCFYQDLRNKHSLKDASFFILGALLPGALWIWYHTSAFGSPFKIALHFQNPVFASSTIEAKAELSRVISWIPNFDIVLRLLKGSARGLLFTQAWILLFFVIFQKKRDHFVWGAALFFIGVFWMNASFPNWWAGASPGPRYLAPSLIPMALALGWHFDALSGRVQSLLKVLLLPCLLLFSLVMSQSILIDNTPLWRDLGFRLFGFKSYSFSFLNMLQFLITSLCLFYFYCKFIFLKRPSR